MRYSVYSNNYRQSIGDCSLLAFITSGCGSVVSSGADYQHRLMPHSICNRCESWSLGIFMARIEKALRTLQTGE